MRDEIAAQAVDDALGITLHGRKSPEAFVRPRGEDHAGLAPDAGGGGPYKLPQLSPEELLLVRFRVQDEGRRALRGDGDARFDLTHEPGLGRHDNPRVWQAREEAAEGGAETGV